MPHQGQWPELAWLLQVLSYTVHPVNMEGSITLCCGDYVLASPKLAESESAAAACVSFLVAAAAALASPSNLDLTSLLLNCCCFPAFFVFYLSVPFPQTAGQRHFWVHSSHLKQLCLHELFVHVSLKACCFLLVSGSRQLPPSSAQWRCPCLRYSQGGLHLSQPLPWLLPQIDLPAEQVVS